MNFLGGWDAPFRTMVLNLWVITPFGGQMAFSQESLKTTCISDIHITIQKSQNYSYEVETTIILWLQVTIT